MTKNAHEKYLRARRLQDLAMQAAAHESKIQSGQSLGTIAIHEHQHIVKLTDKITVCSCAIIKSCKSKR
jgi:hypothetical protein